MAPAGDNGSAQKQEGTQGLTGPEVGTEHQPAAAAATKSSSNGKSPSATVHDEISNVSKKIAAGAKVEVAHAATATPRIPSTVTRKYHGSSTSANSRYKFLRLLTKATRKPRRKILKTRVSALFMFPPTSKGKLGIASASDFSTIAKMPWTTARS